MMTTESQHKNPEFEGLKYCTVHRRCFSIDS